jgi:hypothetical protein
MLFSPNPAGRLARQPPIGVVRRRAPGATQLGLSGVRDARFGGKQKRAEGPAGRVVFVLSMSECLADPGTRLQGRCGRQLALG